MSTPPTLAHALHLFLASHKPTTRESYRWPLQKLLNFLGPDRPVDTVAESHIAEFMIELDRRQLVPATYNKYAKTSRIFFNWLVKHGFIATSPARIFKSRRLQSAVDRSKAMPDEHLHQLLAYTQYRPRDHALILFLADTGCRASGAASLTWDNLRLNDREATITEKGDLTRTVAFGHTTREALLILARFRTRRAGAYVFSLNQRPLLPSSVSQIVSRACLAAGLPKAYGSHSLRHRKGFQLADARVAPSVAARALGHSSPTITLEHYYPNDWDRAKRALEELAVPSQPPPPRKIIRLNNR